MKLYTEQQLTEAIELAREKYAKDIILTTKGIMHQFTPIELPSDEEIEQGLFHQSNEYAYGYKDAFNWMRDKIQGGNK